MYALMKNLSNITKLAVPATAIVDRKYKKRSFASIAASLARIFLLMRFYRTNFFSFFQFIAHGNKFFDNDLCLNRFQNESRLPNEICERFLSD